jgi:hypothetical protein
MPEWMSLVMSILEGLVVVVPLVYALINFVTKASKEKNWDALLQLVMNLMQEAEKKFADGPSRKEWVLMMIKASSDTINYDINLDKVSKLIDDMCSLTKNVNFPVEKVEEETKEC